MRNYVALFLSVIAWVAEGQVTKQEQKIGHADWEYIFGRMPEYKQIEADLKVFQSQLDNQLKSKSQEFDTKYNAYLSLAKDTPEPIRRDKETELRSLQESIQRFQQDIQASFQRKQTDLVGPVFKKVGTAIEEVANEQGYAYIINPQVVGGGDVLLFANEKYNISDLVLKKLGVPLTNK